MASIISPTFIPRAPKPTATERTKSSNDALEEHLNERDRTAELMQRRAFEPPADQAARKGQTVFGEEQGAGNRGQGGGYAPSPPPASAFMPRGSGIGTGGKAKAWSAPQGNFEDARRNGELTPQKIAQATAFAAANGRVFDPTLGYSVNQPGNVPGAGSMGQGAPSQPAAPAPMRTPAARTKFQGPMQPRDNDPALSLRLDQERYGQQPRRAFFTGTMPGERTPTNTVFSINELPGQQEIMTMPDGTQVIPPPGPKAVQSPVPMQVAPAFAPSAATPRAPAATFAPPTFNPTLSAPQGTRKTDFRRFLKTPQGMQFALQHEAGQQQQAAHSQSRAAFANAERGWQVDDREQAKRDKAAEDAANEAGIDSIIGALSGNETALDPMWRDIIGSAKGPKAKQAALDLAINHAIAKDQERRNAAKEDGDTVTGLDTMTTPDGRFTVPIAKRKSGLVKPAGGAYPNPAPSAAKPPADLIKSLGEGYEVAQMDQDGNFVIRPKAKAKESLPQLMREPDGSVKAYDRRTGQPVGSQGTGGYGDGLYSKPPAKP